MTGDLPGRGRAAAAVGGAGGGDDEGGGFVQWLEGGAILEEGEGADVEDLELDGAFPAAEGDDGVGPHHAAEGEEPLRVVVAPAEPAPLAADPLEPVVLARLSPERGPESRVARQDDAAFERALEALRGVLEQPVRIAGDDDRHLRVGRLRARFRVRSGSGFS